MNDEGWTIDYGASRPLKFTTYVVNSENRATFLTAVEDYILDNVNASTVAKMDHSRYYRLVEKMAILICRMYRPTSDHGITKPEVRAAVIHALGVLAKEQSE